VQNGVDDAMVTDEAKAFWDTLGIGESPYVLAVGRVTADKDYDTLVNAFAGLADRSVKLVVAGGRSERGYADRFFNLPGDRVHFIGRIDRRLLTALYDKCALFVNCSLHEGMSNALLEAISFRRPIIASDISANKMLGLNDVSYFPVGDAAALRARIEAALADPSAFVTRRTFIDWTEVTRKTIGVYQQVLPSLQRVDLPAEARTVA
jgi:glycosyltransferase involved in cell wall biosynthesis